MSEEGEPKQDSQNQLMSPMSELILAILFSSPPSDIGDLS
jgi:hypothetical protein